MKIMKKLAAALLVVILICPCFSSQVFAQDGLAFFTDLETSVGENFTITGTVVDKTTGTLGEVALELKYDTTYMRFVGGDDGVTADNGVITYKGSGDGSSDRLTFDMTFQALQEGETQLDQISADVTSDNGISLTDFTLGYSAVTIAEGDPSKIAEEENGGTDTDSTFGEITVGDRSYSISEDFSESQIPAGYTTTEFTYNGTSYQGITNATSGVVAAYLVDSTGSGAFFVFNESKSAFYPYEEIMISDTCSILILDGTDEVKMPEKYTETNIQINSVDFPVWMEPDREGFYIFYAVNSDGEKSLYLYDSNEHTYQRMETPKTAESEGNEVSGMDKMLANVEEHLIWFVVGMGCAILILVVAVVVLAVKLKHRNLELDDLYDEYGIDLEQEKATEEKNYFDGPEYLGKTEPISSENERKLDADYEDLTYGAADYVAAGFGEHEDEYDDYEEEYDDYDDEYDEYEEEYDDYDDEYDEYEDEDAEYDDEYDEYDDYDDEYDDYYEGQELAMHQQNVGMTSSKNNYDSYYDDEDFGYEEDYAADQMKKGDTFEMDFIEL